LESSFVEVPFRFPCRVRVTFPFDQKFNRIADLPEIEDLFYLEFSRLQRILGPMYGKINIFVSILVVKWWTVSRRLIAMGTSYGIVALFSPTCDRGTELINWLADT